MKRLPNLSGLMCTMLLALGALAVVIATPRQALSQTTCGVTVQMAKNCQPTTNVGDKDDCTITLTNKDTCGNTYQVNSGSDVIHASGGDVSDTGLPISLASPGAPPVGTACSTSSGLPCTLAVDGSVTFHDNNYTVVIGDYNINPTTHKLGDTGTVNMTDLCDNNDSGCDSTAVDENAPASTTVQINCSVQLDKQISCDYAYWNDPARGNDPSQTTWNDVGFADSATHGCTAFEGDPIAIRYVAKNNGNIDVDTCSITDEGTDASKIVNDFSIPGTLAAGDTYDTDAHSLDITTNTTGDPLLCPTSIEPNTATLTCTCVGVTPTTTKTDSDTATCDTETCDATIDKQVTCRGTTYDIPCTDVDTPPGCDPLISDTTNSNFGEGTQMQSTSCIGYDSYCSDGSIPGAGNTCPAGTTLVPADQIGVQYLIKSTGQDGLNCTATESNGLVVGGGLPVTTTDITGAVNQDLTGAGGANDTLGPLSFNPYCSDALSTAEASGDTATLNCTCGSLPGNTAVKTLTKTDTAIFSCQQPELSLTKTCTYNNTTTAYDVSITATNNSATANLENCAVTDKYLTDSTDVMCPQTYPFSPTGTQTVTDISSGLSPSNTGAALSANGGTQTWTGTINTLSADACNNAAITCDVAGSSPPVTVSADFQATCATPTLGCETRTPGFWKTHPDTTQSVMTAAGGAIQSCGLDLNNVNAAQDCSAIEDMCSLGQDAHNLGIDPVQANLIFQCAAAELNLAVTQQDGGSCGNTIPGSTLTFDNCCGPTGACATADPANLNACQNAVSNFNALFDNTTLTSTSVLSNPGANPTNCQAANGNGFVNDSGGLSGPSADCGGSRTYLLKTTGGNPHNASTTNNGKHNGQNK